MLIIAREIQQTIVIEGGIRITVIKVSGSQVKLGIDAPPEVVVQRDEIIKDKTAIRHDFYL